MVYSQGFSNRVISQYCYIIVINRDKIEEFGIEFDGGFVGVVWREVQIGEGVVVVGYQVYLFCYF